MNATTTSSNDIQQLFQNVRAQTQFLCDPLETEDFVVQPVVDVSPLKWHLAHTTWFFETFVLVPYYKGYKLYNDKYPYLFNSYYISAGDRWVRANRGQLTRPTVSEIFDYRSYVEKHMNAFLQSGLPSTELGKIIELGCNHEQQHQELFLYDVKRILGDNPLFPIYRSNETLRPQQSQKKWLEVKEGIYEIGFEGESFHFDNEEGKHKVYLHTFQIESGLVTNGEYLEFVNDKGYESHQYWLSEGWDWLKEHNIQAPRYWHQEDGGAWWNYTLGGYELLDMHEPVSHISYYEADAFARWKGCRLPTEFEWEVACGQYAPTIPEQANFLEKNNFKPVPTAELDFWGNLWEWTSSPYTAYPFFKVAEGAIGEYNGKFMVNQMVLRGGSYGTPKDHIRATYRNFFHPHLRWLFSGIRLAKHS